MTWKKTWFNYAIWTLFTIAAAFFLTLGTEYFLECIFNIRNINYNLGGVCLCLIVGAGLFFVISRIKKGMEGKEIKAFVAPLISLAIIALAFSWGIYLKNLGIVLKVNSDDIANVKYVTDAYVGGEGFFLTNKFSEFAFSGIMFGIFSFIGNHAFVAIYAQLILELIAYIFVIAGIVNFSGWFAGAAFAVLAFCLPGMVNLSLYLDTYFVFFAAFAVMFFWLSVIYKRVETKKTGAGIIVSVILAGILSGVTAYANPFGAVLLLLMLALMLANMKEDNPKILISLLGSLCFVATYAALTYFFGLTPGLTLTFNYYLGLRIMLPIDTFAIGAVLILGVFAFYAKKDKEACFGGIILFFVSLILMQVDIFAYQNFGVLHLGLIMAGAMFVGALLRREPAMETTEEYEETLEEVDLDAPEPEVAEENDEPAEETVPEEVAEVIEEVREDLPEETPEEVAEVEEVIEEIKEDIKEEPKEEPKPEVKAPVKYFNVPIKLPKKHESKEADYDHDIDEALLNDYDIEVADNDDFDIL